MLAIFGVRHGSRPAFLVLNLYFRQALVQPATCFNLPTSNLLRSVSLVHGPCSFSPSTAVIYSPLLFKLRFQCLVLSVYRLCHLYHSLSPQSIVSHCSRNYYLPFLPGYAYGRLHAATRCLICQLLIFYLFGASKFSPVSTRI